MSETTVSKSRIVKSPVGTQLNCKGWVQEAAYRMLHNNLDPDVAERPEDLIVYGGLGKAARNWQAFDDICKALIRFERRRNPYGSKRKARGNFANS